MAEKSKNTKKENIHSGHRENLRKAFLEGGVDNMADHVLLELILSMGVPQRDTNAMAHELINSFGSFSKVFRADYEDLLKVKYMTKNAACLIKLLLPTYKRYHQDVRKRDDAFSGSKDIVSYVTPLFEGSYKEKVFLLCFDHSARLIRCCEMSEGDVDYANVLFRDIAKVILETKTRDVVLVHNHPYTISIPSRKDVELTMELYSFLTKLKVNFIDHIIIADGGYTSMRETPKLAPIFCGGEPDYR